ncbi:MAG: hypothetical protein CMI54_02065 [Parcubacteria group bacterium]|jgi:transposase-like protein|nr:hypothetical protein [Parcubacteria group bacterium]|tara:strand:- start:3260 stop:3472 length:213 start_codon:yes stop_codon:yes gene_type:complete
MAEIEQKKIDCPICENKLANVTFEQNSEKEVRYGLTCTSCFHAFNRTYPKPDQDKETGKIKKKSSKKPTS